MTQRTSGTGERALRPLCRPYLSPTGVLFEIHTTALCWRRSALCNQLVETWQLGRHEAIHFRGMVSHKPSRAASILRCLVSLMSSSSSASLWYFANPRRIVLTSSSLSQGLFR